MTTPWTPQSAARFTSSHHAAGERENLTWQVQFHDVPGWPARLLGHDGHAGLDSVNADLGQFFRDADLVVAGEDQAALAALPSRRVTSWISILSGKLRPAVTSSAKFIGLVNH